jgi:hypothetical protein
VRPGTRLGPFEIVGRLGAGGLTKLDHRATSLSPSADPTHSPTITSPAMTAIPEAVPGPARLTVLSNWLDVLRRQLAAAGT